MSSQPAIRTPGGGLKQTTLAAPAAPTVPPAMPIQAQSNPVTIPLKFLAFSTLVVIGSKASPIPQSIGARGLGITSPSEGLITTKVGRLTVTLPQSQNVVD